MIPLFVLIPLIGAFIVSSAGRFNKVISDIFANLACLGLVILSFFALKSLLAADNMPLVYSVGGWLAPLGIDMVLDGLSIFILVIVNLLSFIAIIFSVSYMERYTEKWKYYVLFLIMLAGMNGLVLSGDLFNMYIFLEIGTISSCSLIVFGTEKDELEASFKYLVLSTVGSLFVLLGIAVAYSYASSLNLADLSIYLADNRNETIVGFLAVSFIIGFGLKSALVPFHAWLPDAHPSAPSPISAVLSGVLIKSLGIYSLLRLFYNVLGISDFRMFLTLGALSMVVGGFLAMYQKDMKRLLAYSTISQVGYIMVAFSLNTTLGILSGLFHLVNHAFAKMLLFLDSGSVVYATKERDMWKLGGLRQRMPLTFATSLAGSMSVSGIPPFGGFWSKLLIIIALVQAREYLIAAVAVIISIITLSYYLKFQKLTFFGALGEKWSKVSEAPLMMCVAMVIPALFCLLLGLLLIPEARAVFLDPAINVMQQGAYYGKLVLESAR